MSDHYSVLGLPANASSKQIAHAYHHLATLYSSKKCGNIKSMQTVSHGVERDTNLRLSIFQIIDAYIILSDGTKRAAYDRDLQPSDRVKTYDEEITSDDSSDDEEDSESTTQDYSTENVEEESSAKQKADDSDEDGKELGEDMDLDSCPEIDENVVTQAELDDLGDNWDSYAYLPNDDPGDTMGYGDMDDDNIICTVESDDGLTMSVAKHYRDCGCDCDDGGRCEVLKRHVIDG